MEFIMQLIERSLFAIEALPGDVHEVVIEQSETGMWSALIGEQEVFFLVREGKPYPFRVLSYLVE